MTHSKVKVSYNLGEYAGADTRTMPKQLKPYVRLHVSVVQAILDKIKLENENKLVARLETVQEQPEKWEFQKEFIINGQKQLDEWPEIEERTFKKMNVFRGDLDRCVLNSAGEAFWIDYPAMEDDRIAYWEERLAGAKKLLEFAQTTPKVTDAERAIAVEKCRSNIKEAKLKSIRNVQSVKRAVFNRMTGEVK